MLTDRRVFHLGENVAREEDALPCDFTSARIPGRQAPLKDQGLSWFVEDRDPRPKQCRNQSDFLPVSFRICAAFLGGVKVEALDQFFSPASVIGSPELYEEINYFTAGQVGPQADFTRDVGDPLVDFHRIPPSIHSEYLGRTAGGLQDSQENADGGGFAGTVRANKPIHFSLIYFQVDTIQAVKCPNRLVTLLTFRIAMVNLLIETLRSTAKTHRTPLQKNPSHSPSD